MAELRLYRLQFKQVEGEAPVERLVEAAGPKQATHAWLTTLGVSIEYAKQADIARLVAAGETIIKAPIAPQGELEV